MRAFPEECEGQSARAVFQVLHRVEINRRMGQVQLYVQSRERPNWESLPAGYLAPDESGATAKEVGSLYSRIREGRVLRFRLRANPTRKIDTKSAADGRRRHGRRVPVRGEEAQVEWLARQAQRCGFALVEATVALSGSAELSRSHSTGRTFQGVLYEGHLVVRQLELFRRALAEGIGPAKAFGFGLLSIASE